VDVSPTIKLPEYTGLELEIQPTEPTDAEIDQVIDGLRSERADFKVAERTSAKGDYVRFGYTGSLDGKSIAEIVGDKAIYAAAPQTWEEVEGANEGLLPGVSRLIAGLKTGDKKSIEVTFPADFAAVPALAGKTVTYAIDVQEVRERVLPALDEAFFKSHQVDDLAGLKAQVRASLPRARTMRTAPPSAARSRTSSRRRPASRAGEPDFLRARRHSPPVYRGEPPQRHSTGQTRGEQKGTLRQRLQGRRQPRQGAAPAGEDCRGGEAQGGRKDFNNWLMREAMRSGQNPTSSRRTSARTATRCAPSSSSSCSTRPLISGLQGYREDGNHQRMSYYVPIVLENTGRGERSMDIYSRLLKDRIIFIGTPIDDGSPTW